MQYDRSTMTNRKANLMPDIILATVSVDPHTLPDTLESLRLAPEDVQHVERVNGGRRLLLTLKSGQVFKVYDVEGK